MIINTIFPMSTANWAQSPRGNDNARVSRLANSSFNMRAIKGGVQ
jgi:hypothetical protein